MSKEDFVIGLSALAFICGCEGDTTYYIHGDPDTQTDSGVREDATTDPDATPDASELEPIRLGMVGLSIPEETGPMSRAMAMAIDEINATGGLLGGRMVEFVFEEEPRFDGEDAFASVIEDGAVAVVGPTNVTNAFGVLPIAASQEVPFHSVYGGASFEWGLAQDGGEPWGRSGFWVPIDILAVPGAEVARDVAGCSTAYGILVEDITPTSTDLVVSTAKSAFEGAGLEWRGQIIEEFMPSSLVDMSGIPSDTDCLIVDSPLIGYVLRDRPAELENAEIVILNSLIPPLVAGVAPDLDELNGLIGVTAQLLNPERNTAYVEQYENIYGAQLPPPTHFFMSNAYDATALFLLAIEQSGSTDGAAIRNAFAEVGKDDNEVVVTPNNLADGVAAIRDGKTVNYQGATGTTDYSSGPWPQKTSPVSCYQVTNAQMFRVGPCPE